MGLTFLNFVYFWDSQLSSLTNEPTKNPMSCKISNFVVSQVFFNFLETIGDSNTFRQLQRNWILSYTATLPLPYVHGEGGKSMLLSPISCVIFSFYPLNNEKGLFFFSAVRILS